MSLVKIENIGNARLGIWKIEEDLSDLLLMYTPNKREQPVFDAYRSESRKKQWLATRVLLKSILPKEEITYSVYGSPKLHDPKMNISISHTVDYAAIVINNKTEVGLDIEKCTDGALKISKRFLNEKEREFLSENYLLEHSTLLWSIKEALYKLYEKGNLTYKSDIIVEPFQYNDKGIVYAQLKVEGKSRKYELAYESILDHKLVYCVGNEQ